MSSMHKSVQYKELQLCLSLFQGLLCSLADSWAESSTFHCLPSWERMLWCCGVLLQDSLWISRKLCWINGSRSEVSCWGLACAFVRWPCRSLWWSTFHKSCPAYGPVTGNTMGCLCLMLKKQLLNVTRHGHDANQIQCEQLSCNT